ncbi:unnamed protein product [Heligmosomoides polygyrus]|uniref:DUF930 domain-containing protein n=1 Tax=Heligmosomoides polygyrus TaxID=6339 RepID=A0A183GH89_HELPZ|nr:unnamed protein product [Heligmosomoides polygyrus]
METKMLRRTHGVMRMDRIRNDVIRQMFGVAPIADKFAGLAYDATAKFCMEKKTASLSEEKARVEEVGWYKLKLVYNNEVEKPINIVIETTNIADNGPDFEH